ncbi:probable transcriptional regulatory protein Ddes_0536, partial [Schistocerca gregaria]|uniref:probable transcriptional regulatory protein Ddes_0536 n=1 Tax=Schistocerca gregaria TaxID=7010 RepID=UPI00211E46E3
KAQNRTRLRLLHATSPPPLAGHSHWANIQHHKARKDQAKSTLFAKISKEIIACVKAHKSADLSENPHLSTVLQKARSVNFPKDRIEHSIARGLGKYAGKLEFATYELYGPSRAAFVVSTAADSRNRIVANLRSWAAKQGGYMVQTGSFNFLFDKIGKIEIDTQGETEDDIFEAAINAGCQDVSFDHENHIATISCSPNEETVSDVQAKLASAGIRVNSGEVCNVPKVSVHITDADECAEFQNALDALMQIDGVESVFHNAVLSNAE